MLQLLQILYNNQRTKNNSEKPSINSETKNLEKHEKLSIRRTIKADRYNVTMQSSPTTTDSHVHMRQICCVLIFCEKYAELVH